MMSNKRSLTPRRPRGVVLIAALVCLSIVMALVGSLLLTALQSNRQLHLERDRRQCELLLEAGIARAKSHVSANEKYAGETWRLPAEQITGNAEGQVTIEVVPDPVNSQNALHIVAEYPLIGEMSIRRSQTIYVPFTRPTRQE